MLLTREEQKFRKLRSPPGLVFGIELWEFDLKVCCTDGLRFPTWYTLVTCST